MDLKENGNADTDNINNKDMDGSAAHGNEQEEILAIQNLNVFYSEKGIGLFGKRSRKHIIRDVTVSVKQEKLLVLSGRAEAESPRWQRQLWG